jgi:hypothetical protein
MLMLPFFHSAWAAVKIVVEFLVILVVAGVVVVLVALQ